MNNSDQSLQTVAALIAHLSKFPQDATVSINKVEAFRLDIVDKDGKPVEPVALATT